MEAARPLVILRLGADHRVSGWAKAPRAARGWDLVLSPYQDVPDADAFEADAVAPEAGGKWDALHRLLTRRPELWRARPRIWLPDDDIETDAATVARLFAIAAAEDLALAQPALTPDSEFSHFVTVANRFCRLRRTNFVELMAPVMTPEVLAAILPDMAGRPAAKGLDFVWQAHVKGAGRRIAVIDAAAVAHRRPIGGHLAGRMAAQGRDVNAEGAAWIAARAGRWYRPVATGPGGRAGATALALATLATTPALWQRRWAPRIGKFFWAQLTKSTWQGTR